MSDALTTTTRPAQGAPGWLRASVPVAAIFLVVCLAVGGRWHLLPSDVAAPLDVGRSVLALLCFLWLTGAVTAIAIAKNRRTRTAAGR
ncbi:hypothetical protein [Galactobacter caseinivorans]|uniref:Uncharacterized protein n=1 Tax=Galactobacter caseinivorans TaxID=2676123 RepID=A0A496PJS1_9MICC|nr:hypothetical protein [Galactobacter caseinivorans]RKW70670.1 hypothetical protein DWQ67_06030 [Galactobacter caseinivorans]